MFNGSKSLRSSPEETNWLKKNRLYKWWRTSDFAYDLSRSWRSFSWKYWGKHFNDLGKLWDWYKNVFRDNDFDFDAHSIWPVLAYKLTRVEAALKRGWAIQEPDDMRALALAIKLCKRLDDDKYEEIQFDRHDRRWGRSKHWFVPCNDGTENSWMRSSKPGVITKEDEINERKEFLERMNDANRQHDREVKWLFGIIARYYRVWWD